MGRSTPKHGPVGQSSLGFVEPAFGGAAGSYPAAGGDANLAATMSHRRIVFATLGTMLMSALQGCAGGPRPGEVTEVPEAPGLNRTRYQNLVAKAEKELDCPRDQLAYAYLDDARHQLTGCGQYVLHTLRCEGLGCVWMNDVRKRASFELDCEVGQLTVEALDSRTRGVSGCGHRATYVMSPAATREQAVVWLLNGSSSR